MRSCSVMFTHGQPGGFVEQADSLFSWQECEKILSQSWDDLSRDLLHEARLQSEVDKLMERGYGLSPNEPVSTDCVI